MTKTSEVGEILDVPKQIFEKFIRELEDTGVSVELVARIRKTLLEDQILTENALKSAIFDEEILP